tara:strand:+ start:464 stop:1036 length:573 start_codon:yes stop_codon:yes gene_type:complete
MSVNNDSGNWQYYEWTNAFSVEKVKELNKTIDEEYNKLEDTHMGSQWKNISAVKWVSYGAVKHLIESFVDDAFRVAQYDFGYNIFPYQDCTQLNHNTYDAKDKSDYGWHTDSSRLPTTDIKLTLLINLSEKSYKGGEFQICNSPKEQTIESYNSAGSAFMFKSHILHRVLPLTYGVRKSLSLFLQGPRFQ